MPRGCTETSKESLLPGTIVGYRPTYRQMRRCSTTSKNIGSKKVVNTWMVVLPEISNSYT